MATTKFGLLIMDSVHREIRVLSSQTHAVPVTNGPAVTTSSSYYNPRVFDFVPHRSTTTRAFLEMEFCILHVIRNLSGHKYPVVTLTAGPVRSWLPDNGMCGTSLGG